MTKQKKKPTPNASGTLKQAPQASSTPPKQAPQASSSPYRFAVDHFAVELSSPSKSIASRTRSKSSGTAQDIIQQNQNRELYSPKKGVQPGWMRKQTSKNLESMQKSRRSEKQDQLRGRTSSNNSVATNASVTNSKTEDDNKDAEETSVLSHLSGAPSGTTRVDDETSVHSTLSNAPSDFEARLDGFYDECRQDLADFYGHDPTNAIDDAMDDLF
jgi:hypothetical protein